MSDKKYRLAITTTSGRRWVSDRLFSLAQLGSLQESLEAHTNRPFQGVFPSVHNGEVVFFNNANVETIEFLSD